MRIQDEKGNFIKLGRVKSHKLYAPKSKALKKKVGKKEGMSSKELFGYSPVKRDRAHKKRLGIF